MRLLWLKIYTPTVAPAPAAASNDVSAIDDAEESIVTLRSDDPFEPVTAVEACLDEALDPQYVAPWTTLSVERLRGESPSAAAKKSVSGELRSDRTGTTSTREAS
jgi:hypothetical protein